jgi:hypothetical protein
MKTVGLVLMLLAAAGMAVAQQEAPEIDGQSLGSGLVLISGLLMVARGRMRK